MRERKGDGAISRGAGAARVNRHKHAQAHTCSAQTCMHTNIAIAGQTHKYRHTKSLPNSTHTQVSSHKEKHTSTLPYEYRLKHARKISVNVSLSLSVIKVFPLQVLFCLTHDDHQYALANMRVVPVGSKAAQ